MAPDGKKRRRPIGSMLDVGVESNDSDDDVDFSSDDDSHNSDSDSSNDEEHDQEKNNDSHTNDKAMRGSAKLGFEWGTGVVMMLQLDEDDNVVGNNSGAFATQLGILAKDGNKLPLSYTDWRAVPTSQKDLVWTEVKENTNLTESYKKNCMKKLGKSWKDWKNRLKERYFKPHRHDKQYVLSKCPERVEPNQWPILVNYWSSKNAKRISNLNKKSRNAVVHTPKLGRTDMPNARYEYRQKTGKQPSKLDIFVYSREGGKKLDAVTAAKIEILKEKKANLPEHLRDDIQANDEIYEEVVGKDAPGCLRGSGSTSKGNKLDFISREEFERAVQEKATQEVTSIQKKLEDDILKYKNAWNTEMEALKNRLITLETKDTHVPGSSNSKRIQAPVNLETSGTQSSEALEETEELSNLGENNSNSQEAGAKQTPKDQGNIARRTSKRKQKA